MGEPGVGGGGGGKSLKCNSFDFSAGSPARLLGALVFQFGYIFLPLQCPQHLLSLLCALSAP